MITINFLTQQRKLLTTQQKNDKKLFIVAAMVACVILIFSLISVGLHMFFANRVRVVGSQIDTFVQQVEAYQQQESLYLTLHSKVKALDTILEEREKVQETIDYFSTAFDEGVQIEQMQYLVQTGVPSLELQLVSRDIFVFEDVANLLFSEEVSYRYPNIQQSKLSRTENGTYSVTLTIPIQ